jgi:hypothetical protein
MQTYQSILSLHIVLTVFRATCLLRLLVTIIVVANSLKSWGSMRNVASNLNNQEHEKYLCESFNSSCRQA